MSDLTHACVSLWVNAQISDNLSAVFLVSITLQHGFMGWEPLCSCAAFKPDTVPQKLQAISSFAFQNIFYYRKHSQFKIFINLTKPCSVSTNEINKWIKSNVFVSVVVFVCEKWIVHIRRHTIRYKDAFKAAFGEIIPVLIYHCSVLSTVSDSWFM